MNVLIALASPLVLCAAGIYAGCSCWLRRRRAYSAIPEDLCPVVSEETVEELRARARALEDSVVIAEAGRASGRPRWVLSTDPEAVEARYVVAAIAEQVVREEHDRLRDLYEEPTFTHQ